MSLEASITHMGWGPVSWRQKLFSKRTRQVTPGGSPTGMPSLAAAGAPFNPCQAVTTLEGVQDCDPHVQLLTPGSSTAAVTAQHQPPAAGLPGCRC